MMIKVIAKNVVKKEHIRDFIEGAAPLIEASKREDGCISYDLYQDMAEANVLTFIEEWKDEEAIQFHRETPHYTKIIPELGQFRLEKEVRLYKLAR